MSLLENIRTTYKYNGIKGVFRKIKFKFSNGYDGFVKNEKVPSIEEMESAIQQFEYTPLISIILPVYNPNQLEFEKCLSSLFNQSYKNIEICVVNDGGDGDEVKRILETADSASSMVVKHADNCCNSGISVTSNKAISMANGEYMALVDQDDMLPHHAIYEYVKRLQEKKYDFLYSDEDMINQKDKRFNPQFKPDWSPHTLLSRMYINHLSMYKKTIVDRIGGFRKEFDGTQDYDMLLRASAYFESVCHIPHILYHWRTSENSIATSIDNKSYIIERAEKAIKEKILSEGFSAEVVQHKDLLMYDIEVEVQKNPLVSVIIPFKDGFDVTEKLIYSIIDKSGDGKLEFIFCDNISSAGEKQKYKELVKVVEQQEKVVKTIYLEANYAFNYAKINNDAAVMASGEYLLFLNNDVEFFQENTIDRMVGIAQLPQTGAVGITLLYPNDSIQHAGVILGYHEVAGHSGVGQHFEDAGYYGRNVSLYNFSAVTAACLLVERNIFAGVGGFDEKLTVAYNDVDFCLKLTQKGLFNVHVGNIKAYHHESLTRGADSLENARYIEECRYMKEKWGELLMNDPFYNPQFSLNVGELYQISNK